MRARQPPEPLSDSSSRAAALSRPRCLPMSRGTGRPVQAPRNLAMPAPSRPLQPGIPQSGHKSRFPPLCAGLGATRTRRVASNVRNAGGDDPKLPPLGVGEDVAPACEKERTHSYLLRTRAHTHTPAERHEWEARDPRISRTGKELPSEPLSAFPAAPDPQKKKKNHARQRWRGECRHPVRSAPATPLPYLGQQNAQDEQTSRLHFARLEAPGGVFIHARGGTEHIFRGSQALS